MSPDATWIRLDRWNALTSEQQRKFPPICPDFVVELRSPSDTLKSLRGKMEEWVKLGVKLGWLLDHSGRNVYVYGCDHVETYLTNPQTASGDPILPGFQLDLREIW
jgi:Uma2 family endonuclease